MADEQKMPDWENMTVEEVADDLQNRYYAAEDNEAYWREQAKGVKEFLNQQKAAREAAEAEEGRNYYAKFWRERTAKARKG